MEMETVLQGYAAWNTRDIDGLLEVMHPEVELLPLVAGVTSVAPWHGHDAVRRLLRDATERWHRLELRCDDLVEAGDRLVVFVHVTAAAAPDAVVVEGDVAHVIELDEAQLVRRLAAYRDRAAALAAAGA